MRWLAPLALLALSACGSVSLSSWLGLDDPCLGSEFDCVTLEVPLDHYDPAEERTIEVTFAVLPASGTSEGAYVTAVGGPGESGVAVADFILFTLDPAIPERYDIVLFEHRGLGMGEDLACPETDADPDLYPVYPEDPAEAWEEIVDITSRLIASCLDEIGEPDVLAYLGTVQAVEDLEAFRRHQGYDKLILHGESYGTALVQMYAEAHPEAVERIVLDGPIDLTIDELTFVESQIEAFDHILDLVFVECDQDRACSEDMGKPAGEAYRDLERRLSAGPVEVRLPLGGGEWEKLPLHVDDLRFLAYTSLYSEEQRMLFLRVLAAHSSQHDLVPISRLYWSDPGADLPWVFAAAVSCVDTALPGNTEEEALAAIASAWEKAEPDHRWFYTWALNCVFWPHFDHSRTPGEPFAAQGIPTLVLATTVDPATPYPQAEAVAGRLDQGHLLTQTGGPHVIFGWGEPCVDNAVTRFVLDGEMPRRSSCHGSLLSPYLPLLTSGVTRLPPHEMMSRLDLEIYYLPELMLWDGFEEMAVGCPHGGDIVLAGDWDTTWFELDGCGLAEGLVVEGRAEWDYEDGITKLDLRLEGCRYRWQERWEDGSSSVDQDC